MKDGVGYPLLSYESITSGRVGRSRGGKHKLSPEQELEMVRLYRDENVRGRTLGKMFGCSNTHVYRVIRRHSQVKGRARGQEDQRKIPLADEAAVVWRYSEAREGIYSISRSYACSIYVVYKVLNKFDVPRHRQAQSEGASGTREEKAARPKRPRRRIIAPHAGRRLETMGVPEQGDLRRSDDALKKYFADRHPLPSGRPARPLKQVEEMYGLRAPDAVKQAVPSIPEASKIQASTRNGQTKAPLRVRFPPLPGEPGYEYGRQS